MRGGETAQEYIGRHLVTPRPDCKVWAGQFNNGGYPIMRMDGKKVRAHRVAWELEYGPIPEGMTVDHLCRVRACLNTAHMEIVTQSENAKRGLVHWRYTRRSEFAPAGPPPSHCGKGHEFTPENTYISPSKNSRECAECKSLRRQAQTQRIRLARMTSPASPAPVTPPGG